MNKRSWFQNMLKKHKEQASDVASEPKFQMHTNLNWLIKEDELQVISLSYLTNYNTSDMKIEIKVH